MAELVQYWTDIPDSYHLVHFVPLPLLQVYLILPFPIASILAAHKVNIIQLQTILDCLEESKTMSKGISMASSVFV